MVPRKFRPIVPGSAVTNKQLNRESQGRDPDQVRADQPGPAPAGRRGQGLPARHRQLLRRLRPAGPAAVRERAADRARGPAAVQGTQAGVTGLAATDLTQMNQAATKDAAARGATPGDLAQMASGAAATRQALVGSFAAQQAATNAANSNYAGNRANVVAPGQKLGAVAQAHGRVRQASENLGGDAAGEGRVPVHLRPGAPRGRGQERAGQAGARPGCREGPRGCRAGQARGPRGHQEDAD